MTDRVPGAPGRCKAVVTGQELQKLQAGEEFAITLRRDDQPIKEGTPYSKAAVLPDAVAVKLCPGAQDPTPGDAFAALQSQKADAVRRNVGRNITLWDAAHTPLKGFRIFGQGQDDACVGNTGSITVNLTGKNLLDYRKAYARKSDQTVTVDESIEGLYWTGDYWFLIPVTIPAGTTVCFRCESECADDPDDYISAYQLVYADGTTMYVNAVNSVTTTQDVTAIYVRRNVSTNKSTIKVWNIQLEIGAAATEYEAYQKPQTVTVSTAAGDQSGLAGDGDVYDEIDFEKGVLIHRFFENCEYPLAAEVLESYGKLHTYAPTTVITNNAGADMEAVYYTPTTAVQMVHSSADKDKILSIDEHGCVVLVDRESVTEPTMQKIQQLQNQMQDVEDSFGDRVVYRETAGGWNVAVWESGTVECRGQVEVEAKGTDSNFDHCNLFSYLPVYFTHFHSVEVAVLSTNPTNPGDTQYSDILTNFFMSVFNMDAEAELERLVVRFGCISAGSYNMLSQDVSRVRLSVCVCGTAS